MHYSLNTAGKNESKKEERKESEVVKSKNSVEETEKERNKESEK